MAKSISNACAASTIYSKNLYCQDHVLECEIVHFYVLTSQICFRTFGDFS